MLLGLLVMFSKRLSPLQYFDILHGRVLECGQWWSVLSAGSLVKTDWTSLFSASARKQSGVIFDLRNSDVVLIPCLDIPSKWIVVLLQDSCLKCTFYARDQSAELRAFWLVSYWCLYEFQSESFSDLHA